MLQFFSARERVSVFQVDSDEVHHRRWKFLNVSECAAQDAVQPSATAPALHSPHPSCPALDPACKNLQHLKTSDCHVNIQQCRQQRQRIKSIPQRHRREKHRRMLSQGCPPWMIGLSPCLRFN